MIPDGKVTEAPSTPRWASPAPSALASGLQSISVSAESFPCLSLHYPLPFGQLLSLLCWLLIGLDSRFGRQV